MKVCIIQPLYSADWNDSEKLFQWELDILDKCDESMDLIVLPEATDVPAYAKNIDQYLLSYQRYNKLILDKASETAKRCNSVLFINALYDSGVGLRNTTYAFDKEGNIVNEKSMGWGLVTDERFCDGLYFALSLRQLRKFMRNPKLLEEPLEAKVEDVE